MNRFAIIKKAISNALLCALYIGLIGWTMPQLQLVFGGVEHTALMPIIVLLLLVFSVAITGTALFAQPILWYLDGKKQEGITLLVYTLASFFAIVLTSVAAVYIAFNG